MTNYAKLQIMGLKQKKELVWKDFSARTLPLLSVLVFSFSISVSAPVSSWFHQSAATVRLRHLLKVTLGSHAWSLELIPDHSITDQSQTILQLLQFQGNFLSVTDSSLNKPWVPSSAKPSVVGWQQERGEWTWEIPTGVKWLFLKLTCNIFYWKPIPWEK